MILDPVITRWVRLNKAAVIRDNTRLLLSEPPGSFTPEDIYSRLQCNYPKFFKMDLLCKWAWLGAEILLSDGTSSLYEGMDRSKIAVILATSHGCLDVDKKYMSGVATIPSPALFVYTLPNIMLGETSIRHGFKGEQLCLVSNEFDAEEIHFNVNDILQNRGMEACLCGWVDATEAIQDVCMFWVAKQKQGITFSAAAMQRIYNG